MFRSIDLNQACERVDLAAARASYPDFTKFCGKCSFFIKF